MLYRTNVPLIIKGDYIKKGEEVDLSDDERKQYDAADLSPVDTTPEPAPEPEVEVPIDEMDFDQLKAKAKELGLSAAGSKAAILERIKLHLSTDNTND
jgi:hypothetical protein